jgi:hypothetical protein
MGAPRLEAERGLPNTDATTQADEEGVVSLPPMGINCGSPAKWRNQSQCAVDNVPPTPGTPPTNRPQMGTELDWMTFLFAVNRIVGFNDVLSVYKHACWPDNPEFAGQDCSDKLESNGNLVWSSGIAWTDSRYQQGDEDAASNHSPTR